MAHTVSDDGKRETLPLEKVGPTTINEGFSHMLMIG